MTNNKNTLYQLRLIIVLLTISFFGVGVPTTADASFNPNFLLSDFELADGLALSKAGVDTFLKSKGGGLAQVFFESVNGLKSAADIIYDAGLHYKISQKFLIVLLQKEQSLITTRTPTQQQYDWATGFAVCDSCSKSDPNVMKYRGFFNQVNWAAKRIRESYLTDLALRGFTISGWGPGISKNIDGVTVTPENNATAALYTYTPHVHGNENFVRLWNAWFLRRFPDGLLVKNDTTGDYYLIENGKRRKFRSLSVVAAHSDPRKALIASATELQAYEEGPPLLFPEFSLIRSPRGTVFLMVNRVKRGIASREVFRTIGFNPEEVLDVSWDDINAYPDGPVIDLTSAYPAGALLQSTTTGGIAYVENGVRHAIYAREILRSQFSHRGIIRVTQAELEQYPAGEPVLLKDGELVTAPGERSVYIISQGLRRPIANGETFARFGFLWANVIRTTPRALEIHPLGEPLVFEEEEISE